MGVATYSFFLLKDGTVKAYGENASGQFGNNSTSNPLDPISVPGLSGVKQMAEGIDHGFAILNDGTVMGSGWNDCGQLGDGTTTDKHSFVRIPGLSNVKQLAGGIEYSVVLFNDGTVKACGKNKYGQLGNGTTTDVLQAFIEVPGLSNVKQVAAGGDHTVFLLNDGTVKVCGYNQSGELGDGTYTDRLTPVLIPGLTGVRQVTAAEQNTAFLLNDGTVKMCGVNTSGQLGNRQSPTVVNTPISVPGLSNVKQVSIGMDHSVFLLNDGTVKACGEGTSNQVGDGTKTRIIEPVSVAISNVKQVFAGRQFTTFLLNDGTVKACGNILYQNTVPYPITIIKDGNVVALPEILAEDTPSGGTIQLTAAAGDAQVALSWTAVTGATGYNVKRSTTAGGPYTTIAGNVQGTSYVDTSVINGTTYYYVVTAITAAGESSNSNEASATVKASILAPTNLFAIAGDDKVTLSWTATDGATGYNVKRSTTAGGPYTTIASNVQGTSYVDTSVTNGTTYYYVVTAITASGESANSNEASATPIAAPVDNSKVLLRVTMNDSSEREYQLSTTEVNSFIKWYDRTVGTGNTCYVFDKNVGSEASKEYLAFEKIISFEVKPSK